MLLVRAWHPTAEHAGALHILLEKDDFVFVYQEAETQVVGAEERAASDQPRIQIYMAPIMTTSKPSAVLVVSYW